MTYLPARIARLGLAASLALASLSDASAAHATQAQRATQVHHRTQVVDGVDVFYREAGRADAPVVLLLHGYGASSHMFRELMPRLAARYRLLAPDLPGFGNTRVMPGRAFNYSFDSLARIVRGFLDAKGVGRFAIYVFDYGAPVGWRLAVDQPERISAVISQNGNAYAEGLSEGWNEIRQAWAHPTAANKHALRKMYTLEVTRWQYTQGVKDTSLLAPESWVLAQAMIDQHGHDLQLDLILDYAENVKRYPQVQAWFRERRPPTLAVWGRNDPFFLPAGAHAFKRDNPDAKVVLLDTGHFALETHGREIGEHVEAFLGRHLRPVLNQD